MSELSRLVVELATDLREEVLPELGRTEGREHSGDGAGGDVTFAIDERAEARMEAFLAERAPDVAFYSEDRGMVNPGRRPALGPGRRPDRRHPAGDGGPRVGLRLGRGGAAERGEPTMADVEVGCVVEIKSGAQFLAVRGAGVEPAPRCRRRRGSSGCSGPTASAAGRSCRPRS